MTAILSLSPTYLTILLFFVIMSHCQLLIKSKFIKNNHSDFNHQTLWSQALNFDHCLNLIQVIRFTAESTQVF